MTGGAGFIGSNFVKFLLSNHEDYCIFNLDALTYAGNLKNLSDIEKDKRHYFIKGDIKDSKLVNSLFSSFDFDYVVNFAAESHVDKSIEDPEIFIKTNVLGTLVLLEAAKKYHAKKFLQISTDEVYGSLGLTGYFNEKTPLSPNSPYSASKASADILVNAYYKTYELPVITTRCSNNYGPNQFPEKFIPLIITSALKNKEVPIYGDGLNIRDWLYVEDHCRAIDLVLSRGNIGEVYNIGGNQELTNIEVAKIILKIIDKSESLIIFVKDRPGHDQRYAIDSSKIRKELGWCPQYKFKQGICKTINWYLRNQDWLSIGG